MTISNSDKQALINGTATIPYKINVIKNNEILYTLDDTNIVNIDYEDFRYVDTDSLVIGQFVARKITGQITSTIEVENEIIDIDIENTEFELQLGISHDNNTNYYSLGNFLVTKPTNDDVKDFITFEGLDYTKKFNTVFDGTTLTYPCTALELAQECCRQADVELDTEDFTNYDFVIENNQYVEKDTCRKVMQDIGKLAYSWVRIDWDNKCYIDFEVQNNVDTYNVITNDNYYDLNLQKEVFGPVNRVIIGMKDIDGENVVFEDQESIEEYGATEIKIYDNNLTYTPELRDLVKESAGRLFGLTYTPLETNTTGHPWLIGKEKIQINDMNDNPLYTYPWDRTIVYNGHIKSKISSKADTKTEIEYKNTDDLETMLNKTRIIVDKQNQTISSIVETTQTLSENIDSQNENIEQLSNSVQDTITSTEERIEVVESKINNGIETVRNSLVTIDINGISVSTDQSEIETLMTNEQFKITSGDTTLAWFGYDSEAGETKAEMDNLTVQNYFVTGYHRFEKFEVDGEHHTGVFYIGE